MNPQDTSTPTLVPKIYKGDDQLKRAYDFVSDQLKRCWQDHENRSQKWLDWNNAYRLIDEQKPDEGASVVDPEPQIEVDTLTSNYVESFLGQDPPFKFSGMDGDRHDEEQASIMTSYVSDGLRRINLREKFERTIRQGLIYGTMLVKTPYKKDFVTRKVKQREVKSINDDGTIKYEVKVSEKKFPKMDDTDWEFVSIFDFFPVGRGNSIQTLDGVIQFFERSYEELLGQKQTTEKVDGIEKVTGIYYGLDNIIPIDSTNKLSVCEYWGKIPKNVITGNDDDQYEVIEGLITCVISRSDFGKRMLRNNNAQRTGELTNYEESINLDEGAIRFQENPYWDGERPYLACPYTPIDDEFYGIGIIEPMIEKWYELNTTIRQILDNKTLQLLNPTIEDINANVQRSIKLVKNPRIKADDINGVKTWPIADFSVNGYNAVAALKDEMRRGSGAVESIQGVASRKDSSATEFAGIAQQAGIRIRNKIKLIDESLFKPFLERCYKYAQQFSTEERVVRVLGAKGANWIKVRPDDIYGTLDIITNGPTQIENGVVMANKMIQYLGIAARAPQFANIPYLLGEIWVKLGFPESDRNKVVLEGSHETAEEIQHEVVALSMGQRVMVKPNQNHKEHLTMKIQAYDKLLSENKVNEQIENAFRDNIDKHEEFMKSQEAQGGRLGAATPPEQLVQGLESPNPVQEGAPSNATGARV